MLVKVINPNTTVAMTALIAASARAVTGPGTQVVAVTPSMGPASIESHYDEALAVPGVLAAIAAEPVADGYVVACFGDPGLDAARELASGPVVGIAEAALRTVLHLANSFSVVTTLARTMARTQTLVDHYGARRACRSVRACEVAVLDLERDPEARKRITEECRAAIEADGAEAIVLGCAGMADLAAALQDELGVPVVDGVAAAMVVIEGLVRLGVSTSRAGEYARPLSKPIAGPLGAFALT
jgi:allantoin racemase